MVRKILPMLLALVALSVMGCDKYGDVEQGRVVKYDKTTKPPTAWIVKDSGLDARNPKYDVLPAHKFVIPEVPGEMGQEPVAALRVNLNVTDKTITMYNFETNSFDKIPFELISNVNDVSVRKRHPLVWDEATRKERKFPEINATERTIKIYSRRQEMLSEIKLAPEHFAKYKAEDWDAGDEVRIYYKEDGKALRFMNVTRTNINRR